MQLVTAEQDRIRLVFFAGFFVITSMMILPGRTYRILGVFSYNGKSHFNMYERLLKGLAEGGHRVDVVSHFPLDKPFPNYNQIANLAGTVAAVQNNLTFYLVRNLGKTHVIPILATTIGGELCDFMDQPGVRELIQNPPKDPPYDVLITDIFGATCYLALGQHFGVPVIGTVSSATWPWLNDMVANPDDPAYIPNILSDFDGKLNFWDRFRNTLELVQQKWQFDHYTAYQDAKIKKYIGPRAQSLREAERSVSLILVNSHFSLNGGRPFTTAVVEVGGLHIPDNVESLPNDLEKWLNESNDGFVYISFGSLVRIESVPEEMLHILYASIAKLSPIRVLMRIVNLQELPPGLPDNVITYSWIPQTAVLNHKNIRAFMTHGGVMGIQEAVYYGVPMIGVPIFFDQAYNTKLCVTKNTAVSLDYEQLTVEKLDAAFNTVLNDPSYMKAAKKLSVEFRDRPMSALDTAIFWVEYVARHGGASLRSPAMDLTWWQIALLDVYGALVFAIVSAMYLFKLIIVKLMSAVTKISIKRVNRSKKFK